MKFLEKKKTRTQTRAYTFLLLWMKKKRLRILRKFLIFFKLTLTEWSKFLYVPVVEMAFS